MAKKNFYAVKVGKLVGIFNSWDECKPYVDGVKGAQFKGFKTKIEAEKYLKPEQGDKDELIGCNGVEAYVDGSFDPVTKVYGYGCVFVKNGEEIFRFCGAGDNPESSALRNVAGEMIAAMKATQYAVKNGYKSLRIYYDYVGIERWVSGTWQAKNTLTSKYARYMKEQCEIIEIKFEKVDAHTGIKYNEIADYLAKAAVFKYYNMNKQDGSEG